MPIDAAPLECIRTNNTQYGLLLPDSTNITQTITQANIKTIDTTTATSYTISKTLGNVHKDFAFTWGTIKSGPVSSLVGSVKDKDISDISYPFVDLIFSSIGTGVVPALLKNGTTGYFTPFSTNNKLYLDGINTLNLSFRLTWS
jgi:hypothetical protein